METRVEPPRHPQEEPKGYKTATPNFPNPEPTIKKEQNQNEGEEEKGKNAPQGLEDVKPTKEDAQQFLKNLPPTMINEVIKALLAQQQQQ